MYVGTLLGWGSSNTDCPSIAPAALCIWVMEMLLGYAGW
jgi:hypothetical protein